jgi:hypothetical protein
MVQTMDEVLKIALADPLTARPTVAETTEPVEIADDTITH